MMRLLALAAIFESVTGLILMVAPAIFGRLLLNADPSGPAIVVGRVAGFALLALGLACWPGSDDAVRRSVTLWAMLTYNVLITGYLLALGIGGEYVGVLLWPGIALHGLLTLLLVRACLSDFLPQTTDG